MSDSEAFGNLIVFLVFQITQVIHDDITEDDSPTEIARKVFMSNIQALYDTLEVLDEQALGQAIILLQNAKQILLVGAGTSAPIVTGMYWVVNSVCTWCHFTSR